MAVCMLMVHPAALTSAKSSGSPYALVAHEERLSLFCLGEMKWAAGQLGALHKLRALRSRQHVLRGQTGTGSVTH